ncbi:hypothetical protein GS399_00615 [Pedobacter sp. HMF7647]|uniref:Uncharacterized protein n=1 Tax=Hufsiella arboris TaxID=2695275 RepID=A0A7K1Y4F1_9SPHI|nr:hypothetical protein [Hufsiella arboris]MXV49457.1 hypothetical protein [Hufsiella arboris]
MTHEEKEEIQNAFDNANDAIKQLELIIKKHVNTPHVNINPNSFNLVNIPDNYIRKRQYFTELFDLDVNVSDPNLRASIAYALMQNDLHTFVLYRINLFGIVKKLFVKQAIINLTSIIEALLISKLSALHAYCVRESGICKYNSSCPVYINSTRHIKGKQAINLFHERLGLPEKFFDQINKLFDIRNNIHLSIIASHEYNLSDYSHDNFILGMKILAYLKENLKKTSVAFEDRRIQGCRNLPIPVNKSDAVPNF